MDGHDIELDGIALGQLRTGANSRASRWLVFYG